MFFTGIVLIGQLLLAGIIPTHGTSNYTVLHDPQAVYKFNH